MIAYARQEDLSIRSGRIHEGSCGIRPLAIFRCGLEAFENIFLRDVLDVRIESERFRIKASPVEALQIVHVRCYPGFHDLDHEVRRTLRDGSGSRTAAFDFCQGCPSVNGVGDRLIGVHQNDKTDARL